MESQWKHYLLYSLPIHCCCCCSITQLCLTLCKPMDCSTLGFPALHISWTLLKLMSIKSVMPSNHLVLSHPLLLLPSIFPSIRVFSNELAPCIRWPKYWSFSFSISLQWIFRVDFLYDWLVGSPCSPRDCQESSSTPQFSSKASILRHSAFFMVQLSHPYMTTGKTTALIRRTFVGKVMIESPKSESRSVVSDSLRPHGLQNARPACPSPTHRACSNSCPSNQWCHPIISSPVIPFFSCLQSLLWLITGYWM